MDNVFKVNVFKVNGKIKIIPLIALTLLPLCGGALIGVFIKDSLGIYAALEKPIFAPPPIVFIVGWTILYLLMGLASYRIYMLREQGRDVGSSLFFYLTQLLLNYLWPIIFFSLRLYGLAFIELIVLFVMVIITFIEFIKLDKTAGILFIPYLAWLAFAGVLNFFVWLKNEM